LGNKQETPRVLMIGPGEGIGGGISTLVKSFLPELMKRTSIYYFASVNHRELRYSGKCSLHNVIITVSQYIRFFVALGRYHPNIIHIHTSQGLAWLKDTFYIIIGKAVNCKVLLHMHGGNFDQLYHGSPRLIKAYTRRMLGLADIVISVSTEWKNRLTKIIPANRIYPLVNCVDCQLIQPDPSWAATEMVNILFMGRIGQNKGVFDLIDALHIIQSEGIFFHAQFVGGEEKAGDYQRLNQRIEQYELKNTCEILGSVEWGKALQLLKDASLFVLPSYYEGLPMVILEALAAGLPVVATPVGGIPEVVRDEYNGYLVPVGDTQLLADRLANLVGDAGLRKIMGQRSREIAVKELNVGTYIEKLETLYSQIITR
jgi:glycosyltransferase involved in cell wall biosynthesis